MFHFLETVLLEVLQLFPSSYIHIGGDEVRCMSPSWCISNPAVLRAGAGFRREGRVARA